MSPDNHADDDPIYRFTPITILTMVKFSRGSARLLLGSTSAWAVRESSEAHSSPREGLIVSSTHLEFRMASLTRGYCWGSWPSEASPTSGQADDFGSRAASVTRRDFRVMGLTKTLILLMLREVCCVGMVLHGGASLRCRRHRRLYSGDEGSRGPRARCAGREHHVRGQRRHGRDVRRGATRPGQDRYFGAKGAALLDTWLPPTCKEGTVRGRDKGCRV
jgi:hypothetical protein